MAELLLVGDISPVGVSNLTVTQRALDRLHEVDLVVGNLEAPVVAPGTAARAKAGPSLRSEKAALDVLAESIPRMFVSLANNHAMDFGTAGLASTQRWLQDAGWSWGGVGVESVARAPAIVEVDGIRIGILCATDPQFGIADDTSAGTAKFDMATISAVQAARAGCDRLIVSIHGGAELSFWPSPGWLDALRALIDAGADVVHAHHPHLHQGTVRYNAGWIMVSPGNFLVNPVHWSAPATRQSFGLRMNLRSLERPPVVSTWMCGMEDGRMDRVVLDCPRPTLPEVEMGWLSGPLENPSLLAALWQEYALDQWQRVYEKRFEGDARGAAVLRNGVKLGSLSTTLRVHRHGASGDHWRDQGLENTGIGRMLCAGGESVANNR